MKIITQVVVASLSIVLITGCSTLDSFGRRKLPSPPTAYKAADSSGTVTRHNIESIRTAVQGLQDKYAEIFDTYNSDTANFDLAYLAIATATAAAAVFGAHPDTLKGLAIAAGATAGGEQVLSPQTKRDALLAAQNKLLCVDEASLPLLALFRDLQDTDEKQNFINEFRSDQNKTQEDLEGFGLLKAAIQSETTEEVAVDTIVTTTRGIHFNLMDQFIGQRIDYKTQVDSYLAAANAAADLRKKTNEADGVSRVLQGSSRVMTFAKNAADLETQRKEALAAIRKCGI